MTARRFPIGVMLLAMSLSPATVPAAADGQKTTEPPTVVELSKTQHGSRYKVNSRPTGNTSDTDILYALNEVRAKGGPDAPVIVLADSRVSLDDIWNLEGTADKAQLNNLRFFIRIPDTRKMVEIKWGPAIPYSTNPPLK